MCKGIVEDCQDEQSSISRACLGINEKFSVARRYRVYMGGQ